MTIHIAGLDVQVGSRVRQRCAWCGEILDDRDLANEQVTGIEVPKPPPGVDPAAWTQTYPYETAPPAVRCYPVGELVEITATPSGGGRAVAVIEHRDGDPLPIDCCANLDEEVTHAGPSAS